MTSTKVRGAIPGFSSLTPDPPATPASPIGENPPPPVQTSPFGDQSRPVIPPVENPPTEEPQPSTPPRRNQRLRDRVKSAIDGTPTTTSDTAGSSLEERSVSRAESPPVVEKLTKATATEVVLGGVGVAMLAAAVVVRMRYAGRRQLRKPTDDQEKDIARPLASLLMRHAGMNKRLPDLIDALGVIGAVGNWANEGPLTYPKYAEAEMPQTEESS